MDLRDLSKIERIVEKSQAEYFAAIPKKFRSWSTHSITLNLWVKVGGFQVD